MSFYKKTLGSGENWVIYERGAFVRIMAATSACKLTLYRGGSVVTVIDEAGSGLWRRGDFERIELISSAAGNVVSVMVDNTEVGLEQTTVNGEVTTVPKTATVSQYAATVTTAAQYIIAASVGRKYMLIKNQDAAGAIWVNFAGALASQGSGLKIPPGGYFESNSGFISGASISAIGDIASNANVIVITG